MVVGRDPVDSVDEVWSAEIVVAATVRQQAEAACPNGVRKS
jgi:hypothetical protein